MCGHQRATYGRQFSPPTMSVLGTGLRESDLAESVLYPPSLPGSSGVIPMVTPILSQQHILSPCWDKALSVKPPAYEETPQTRLPSKTGSQFTSISLFRELRIAANSVDQGGLGTMDH